MNAEEIELAYAIKNAAERIDDISNNLRLFNNAMNLITSKMINEGKYNFPTNIPEFIKFIKNNNMDTYISSKLPNEPFFNQFSGINESVLEFTDEKNSEEKVQKIMKELLDICRLKNNDNQDDKLDWETIYKEARLFICNNYLIEKTKLDIELNKRFPYEIAKKIEKMYEKSNYKKGEIVVCPVCGRPLDYTHEKDGCELVCKYYKKIENIGNKTKYMEGKSRLYNLSPGLYKYILIPNIGEYRIYTKLKEKYKDLEVTLYPDIDEYDISIYDGEICINIDVKDHRSPSGLVKRLKENSNLYKLSNISYCYLVIPNHRVRIYKENENKKYMDELYQLLQQEEINIKVIQEKHLINKIDQILGEDI